MCDKAIYDDALTYLMDHDAASLAVAVNKQIE
jgi:hypothetical protein